ncbi:lamin tail domain-containing protein [Streptomyces sp. NPDC058545]|uniref:lamin tail domain-containing protein n=1 Tax=Streptomyces sp. NPDC058545 TaxID=3346544 RepID=UPI0036495AA5
MAATVLAAGAVVSAFALPASAHDNDRHRQPRVEISAVQADSPGRDNRTNRSLNAEWVELTNNSRRAVNLDGWTLRDEDGHRYRFDDVRLAGRATVRIHTGVGRAGQSPQPVTAQAGTLSRTRWSHPTHEQPLSPARTPAGPHPQRSERRALRDRLSQWVNPAAPAE